MAHARIEPIRGLSCLFQHFLRFTIATAILVMTGACLAEETWTEPPDALLTPLKQGAESGDESRLLPAPVSKTPTGNSEVSADLPPDLSVSGVWTVVRTGGALAVVIAIMFAAKSISGRWGRGRADAPVGIVTVLARYPLGRKQSILLLKIDRRILVIAQHAGSTSTLSELTSPEDVASLLRNLREARGDTFGTKLEEMLRTKEDIAAAFRKRRPERGIGVQAARSLLARIRMHSSAAAVGTTVESTRVEIKAPAPTAGQRQTVLQEVRA